MDSTRASTRCNIVIVDDDQLVRDFAAHAVIFHTNRRIVALENGFDGWQYIQNRRHEVDMVIADAHLPDMDGLELLTLVKQDDPGKRFILTSSNGTHEQTAGRLGADAFLAKPYDVQDLLRIIQELVRTHGATRPTQATIAFPTPDHKPS
ncbi:response regulator transcription factor [Desulfatitalea alkaliphila]|uniref:Response regulator n=1 Tax=Desulfatitalea alkaliphila TaxID=2929485 RepID=A0AA41UKB2_9BACT|nr:response regulator [Desulfatitalea alkaliphila]MCJ8500236.1 response regulator [Desulfatitalea alkaliphila]